MSHKCENTDTFVRIFEKLDSLTETATLTHHAVCGNGVPGLHQRVTKLEKGIVPLAAFCIGVGTILGGAVVLLSKIV